MIEALLKIFGKQSKSSQQIAHGRLDLGRVHRWLSTDAYWALGRSRDFVEQAAAASVNFGVYGPDGAQVGYARVVTDGVAFGWLCDVYVAREVRGRGLGVALSRTVAETFINLAYLLS